LEHIGCQFDTIKGSIRQPLPYDKVIETRPQAREKLKELLIESSKNIKGIHFEIGPDKDLETANNKAIRDYNGDKRAVTDYVRAKICVDSPDQVRALTGEEFQDIMNDNDVHVVKMNNYFSDPKDRTGYRCLNYKLAIPIGIDEQDNQQYHYVELQVVAEQIEAVYDETHEYKRRAENAENEIAAFMHEHGIYELKNKEISEGDLTKEEEALLRIADITIKPLRKISKLNYATCYLLNSMAAKGDGNEENNYETLLDPDKAAKHRLTPGKKERLGTMKHKADMMEMINE